jgi:hypothetical protein
MWGKDVFADYSFSSPHSLYISPEDQVWITDHPGHTMKKLTLDGKLLLTLGTEGKPGKDGGLLLSWERQVRAPANSTFPTVFGWIYSIGFG